MIDIAIHRVWELVGNKNGKKLIIDFICNKSRHQDTKVLIRIE